MPGGTRGSIVHAILLWLLLHFILLARVTASFWSSSLRCTTVIGVSTSAVTRAVIRCHISTITGSLPRWLVWIFKIRAFLALHTLLRPLARLLLWLWWRWWWHLCLLWIFLELERSMSKPTSITVLATTTGGEAANLCFEEPHGGAQLPFAVSKHAMWIITIATLQE
jgi:hypothetical protein